MSRIPTPSRRRQPERPLQRSEPPNLSAATLRLTDHDIDNAVANEVASKILVHNMQEQIKDLKERADRSNHLKETIDRRFDNLDRSLANHTKEVERIATVVEGHQRLIDSVDLLGLSEKERRALPQTLRMGISVERFTRGIRGVVIGASALIVAAGAVIEIIKAVTGH